MAFWKPSRPSPAKPATRPAEKPAEAARSIDPNSENQAKLSQTAKLPKLELQDEVAGEPAKRGFDPYNSGVFNVKDTWSKVNRKK